MPGYLKECVLAGTSAMSLLELFKLAKATNNGSVIAYYSETRPENCRERCIKNIGGHSGWNCISLEIQVGDHSYALVDPRSITTNA